MTNKIEELTSRAVGAAKAAKATVEGIDGVFRHLEREHGEATALLLRLKLSSDPQKRRELWSTVRAELLSHERAEVAVLYPEFRNDSDLRVMATEHDQDAQGLEEAIAELDGVSAESESWQPSLERLIALVQEHVRDEEDEDFPIADRVFKDRSRELLEQFEAAKAAVKRQLTDAH